MNPEPEEELGPGAPRRRRRFLIGPILIALAIIAFKYFTAEEFTNPETGQTVRVSLSSEQEQALGLQSYQQVLRESQTVDSGPQHDMVLRVARRLIPLLDERSRRYEWSASLVKSDVPNAFCLPGGKIVVFTGILPITQNEAGLAAVMGHEIAHATARHGAQRIFQNELLQTAMSGMQGSLAELDPEQQRAILGVLGAGVQYGLVLPYGRDHENEADKMGLMYMARAGYDPEEALRFWLRMEEVGGANPPEWASTHPSHGTRIQRLRELMPAAMEQYRRAAAAR
ncbi:MAG TPA: M48 family metallopeptidase [Verrucomicrobiae bacterium]|nr:M48 family metallopeptidase [Verrucomicrobiae bacterium]